MTTSTNWYKKTVDSKLIESICNDYNLENRFDSKSTAQILASILARRNVTNGKDILYYLEDDMRFMHNPFLFNSMEDAVERILQAKDEGEKVLIFGDKDVDGISSTTILYEYLKKSLEIDVECRLPVGDDSYGLSLTVIDDFASKGGTLIITVDCGISNNDEIDYACSKGIDVIVTDHHNPPDNLPNAIIIIDPKLKDSTYPFHDISGAAVAFKLVDALRFSQTDFYNAEICILEIQSLEDKTYSIDCVKVKNLNKVKEFHEQIIPGKTSIYDLKLPYFLQNQVIYTWDSNLTKQTLKDIFGNSIEFNLYNLREEVSKIIPSIANKTSSDIQKLSSIAKYLEEENSVINSLFNLYVSYCRLFIKNKYPSFLEQQKKELQLVALAALADVMPMKNENRLFVKNGISSIKNDGPRQGLSELFNKLNVIKNNFSSIDLSWTIIPALNAAGRMGKSNLCLELLTNDDPKQREILANTIYDLNEERKNLVSIAISKIGLQAKESLEQTNHKLCVVADDSINKGITGILAARLMQDNKCPAVILTFSNDICIGSMRSCRGIIATDFLDKFQNFFINHGGHDFAAGFSFEKSKINDFLSMIRNYAKDLTLEEESGDSIIDAEIPPKYFTPDVFNLIDFFEPYGSENSELLIMSNNMKICDAAVVGKKEPYHLKLTFDCGSIKIPGMLWSGAERLKNDINIGEKYDLIFNLGRNYYNGITTPQITIKEIRKSQ